MKNLFAFLTFPIFCAFTNTLAQTTYIKAYSGYPSTIESTSDGGYIICGSSYENFTEEILLTKLNASGDTSWIQHYNSNGFIGPNKSMGYGAQQTADGGYILIGTNTNQSNSDQLVIKTDSSGAIIWTKIYHVPTGDKGEVIKQTDDGGYIIGCTAFGTYSGSTDFYVIKTNQIGDTIWTGTYGGTSPDLINSLKETSDGGYILIGVSNSFLDPNGDTYVVRIDSNGTLVWSKDFDFNGTDLGMGIEQTSDGGFVLSGNIVDDQNEFDLLLMKLDTSGTMKWTKSYGTAGYEWDNSLIKSPDQGFLLVGFILDNDASFRPYVLKTDSLGNIQWSKAYGSIGKNEGMGATTSNDSGYAVLVISYDTLPENTEVIKIDATGHNCTEENYPVNVNQPKVHEISPPTIMSSWGSIVLPDIVTTRGGAEATLCFTSGIEELPFQNSFSIYPNPSNGNFSISFDQTITKGPVQVFSILGEKVFEESISNTSKTEIDLGNISRGIYFVEIIDGEKRFVQKLIVQ